MLSKQKSFIDPVLKKWLQEFMNTNTQKLYRAAVNKYMKLLKIKDLETYLNSNPDVNADMRKFLALMNGKPPKTVKNYANAIKLFLNEKGHKLEPEDWKKLTRRGYVPRRARAETQDKKPSKEILRNILNHSNIKGRSLFLFMVSSGTRIGETLQLKKDDLKLDADPPRAYIRAEYTKGGVGARTVYFSYEARDAIKEWYKVKDTWKKRAVGGTHGGDRVFPWTSNTARFMLSLACDKSEVGTKDKKTNRRIYHLHSLRKFFRSNSGLGVDITNALMGHSEYLDSSYLRLDEEGEIAKEYLKAMPNLSVFTVEDKTLQKKTENLEEENVELKKRVKQLEADKTETEKMKEKMKVLETTLTEVLGKIAKMSSNEN
jgi:integrase